MKIINLENAATDESKKYAIRNTARAIILDDVGNIASIYISKGNYYQIVGGGIEEGESKEDGLRRECLEEAGVNIEIISTLCEVREIKKFEKQIQVSYCYVAKVSGTKGKPSFTKEEKEYGFEITWMEKEALKTVNEKRGYDCLAGQYAHERHKAIMEEYIKWNQD